MEENFLVEIGKEEKCRLCMKTIGAENKSYKIENDIQTLFLEVTGISLATIEDYSHIACELCLRTLQHFSAVKTQFIETQYKLLHKYKRKLAIEPESESDSEMTASSPKKSKIDVGWMNGSGSDNAEELKEDKEIYECTVCGMHFTYPWSLKRHLKNIHKMDYTPQPKQRLKLSDLTPQQLQNKCKVCSRGFANPWSLSRHINNVHKNESGGRNEHNDDDLIRVEVKCEPLLEENDVDE